MKSSEAPSFSCLARRTAAAAAIALSVCGLPAAAHAAVITVDGNPSDWGIHTNGNAADWTPSAGILATVEDQNGGLGTYLGPGYGGQRYDAEALYAWKDATNLFIALVTGLPPDTRLGSNSFPPGDFLFDFGRDGVYDFGVVTTNALKADGTQLRPGLIVGGLYAVTSQADDWYFGLWSGQNANYPGGRDPVALKCPGSDCSLAGIVDVATGGPYSPIGALGGNHYVIEASVPMSLFGSRAGQDLDIQWAMFCGNDVIQVDPPGSVPEPATLPLAAAGLAGLLWLRRRQR
ncbi:MAG: hypothetical protein OHK0026_08770 [Rhodocyclaceae bacterium]